MPSLMCIPRQKLLNHPEEQVLAVGVDPAQKQCNHGDGDQEAAGENDGDGAATRILNVGLGGGFRSGNLIRFATI